MSALLCAVTGTPKVGSNALAVASTCAGPALNGAPLPATVADHGIGVVEHWVEIPKEPVTRTSLEARWVTVPES